MKIGIAFILLCVSVQFGMSQSKTTEALHGKNSEALALFFYNNTLRMLNQKDDPEFDALIKDIEKMKFLMIPKAKDFNFKKLVDEYKSEAFEEVMTSRHEGKNFDVYVKERNGKTSGMLVLINDLENLYVLDIVGSIALNNVTKLYQTLDESADIGRKIKVFSNSHSENDSSQQNGH